MKYNLVLTVKKFFCTKFNEKVSLTYWISFSRFLVLMYQKKFFAHIYVVTYIYPFSNLGQFLLDAS